MLNTKPITIREAEGGFTVEVCDRTARASGYRGKKEHQGKLAARSDGKLVFSEDLAPKVFTLDEAKSVAHTAGRYLLGFGDFVFAYTDAPVGTFET